MLLGGSAIVPAAVPRGLYTAVEGQSDSDFTRGLHPDPRGGLIGFRPKLLGVREQQQEERFLLDSRGRKLLEEVVESDPEVQLIHLLRLPLEYVNNFERYFVPKDIQVRPKPPRVMRSDSEWPDICAGLVSKGVCEIWPIDRLHHIDRSPLLNGMFSGRQGEFKGNLETQRLIMNLVPVNSLCKSLTGDVGPRPAISGMNGYLLEQGEVALLSSEDICCFFYLFAIPEQWKPYMGFNNRYRTAWFLVS